MELHVRIVDCLTAAFGTRLQMLVVNDGRKAEYWSSVKYWLFSETSIYGFQRIAAIESQRPRLLLTNLPRLPPLRRLCSRR